MTVLYADTSALARIYLEDEPDHAALRAMILDGDDAVTTSDLARVELARAMKAAERTGRIGDAQPVLALIERHLAADPVVTIRLDPERLVPRSRELVLDHRLTTLDAVHLAVALSLATLLETEELVFVTRDRAQAAAARSLGLTVR